MRELRGDAVLSTVSCRNEAAFAIGDRSPVFWEEVQHLRSGGASVVLYRGC